VAQELGGLALGPLDPVQFTALLDPEKQVDPLHLKRLEEAVSIMEWDLAEVSPVGLVEVDPGTGLRDTVADALAERGRAYGAVRTAALLRGGSYSDARDERLLGRLPFRDWRSLERELAPPLVVVVEGRDLDTASGLAEFLDGGQKVVLLVRGPCSPAPLARLMAPGILVAQAGDPEAFERLASFPGPGVAALVPEGAARFVHDPDAEPGDGGDTGGARATGGSPQDVDRRNQPEATERRTYGSWSAGSATRRRARWPVRRIVLPRERRGECPLTPGTEAKTRPRPLRIRPSVWQHGS
jgi:hypothetical protein